MCHASDSRDADRILPITASGLRTGKLIKGARLLMVKDGPHWIPWTHCGRSKRRIAELPGREGARQRSVCAAKVLYSQR